MHIKLLTDDVTKWVHSRGSPFVYVIGISPGKVPMFMNDFIKILDFAYLQLTRTISSMLEYTVT